MTRILQWKGDPGGILLPYSPAPGESPPIFISTLLRTVFILPDTVIEFLDGWKFPSGPGYFVSEPNGQVKLGLGSD